MKVARWIMAGALTCTLGACESVPQFPSGVEKRAALEPRPDFGVLQAEPEVYRGRGILLAGSIAGVEPLSTGVLIVSQRLAVMSQVAYPTFRPLETTAPQADQLVLFYPGHIDPQGLLIGNKFVAVAQVQEFKRTTVIGVSKTEPYFLASCLHIWKTGHNQISDFHDRYNQTYARLEEDTYCTKAIVPLP